MLVNFNIFGFIDTWIKFSVILPTLHIFQNYVVM
jgi:hypothetical protein